MREVKKLISILLSLIMVLSLFTAVPFTAGAVTTDLVSTSDISGNYEYKVLDDGTAEIIDYNEGSIENTELEIPRKLDGYTVSSIGSSAFNECTSLKSVKIPDSVTSIGYHAFSYCTSLAGVTIPDSVTSIDEYAFSGCTSLESITIPNSVTSIGEEAFRGCTSLTSVTIPDSVTSIGGGAFYGCTSLTSVTIPDSVTSIGWSAFSGCTSLTSVTIPNSVTSIYRYTFSGCTSLKSVTIPDSVKSIDEQAFSGCKSLTSIVIPDSVTSIGKQAFSGCKSLTSITIPDSVTSIGYEAFKGCTSLAGITIGNGITRICTDAFNDTQYYRNGLNWENDVLYIGDFLIKANDTIIGNYKIKDGTKVIADRAFEECTSLTGITIPDSVTSIGYDAFSYCTSLASITIPDSVTSIGDYAFHYCSDLTSITIPDSVTSIGELAFYNTGYYNDKSNWENGVLYIDNFLIEADYDVSGEFKVKDGTKAIADEAFYYESDIKSITIPDSVTSIGDGAFGACTSLAGVTIPDSVTSIGDYAFIDCTSLKSVTIPDSVTSIGVGALNNTGYYNDSLNWINGVLYIDKSLITADSETVSGKYKVKDGTKVIADFAFSDCTSLTSVTIPDSVTSIGKYALGYSYDNVKTSNFKITGYTGTEAERYADDNDFEFVSLDEAPTEPPTEAPRGNYKYVVLEDGTAEITEYNESSIENTELEIPSKLDGYTVTSIGRSAFGGCTNLTSVTIPDSVTSIGETAFGHCYNLNSVTIPDSVTSIGESAFRDCWSLESVTIGNGVTSIGEWAFSGCENLTSVTIPDSVTSIGESAFRDCIRLTGITIPGSVTSIGVSAFNNTRYYNDESNWDNGVLYIDEFLIVFRTVSVEHYTVKDGTKVIADEAFHQDRDIKSITIPDSVTSIGERAFSDCENLTSVKIGNSVTSIGVGAFSGCESLKSVTIPDSVTSMGDSAFNGCESLTSVTIGNGVTSIYRYTFEGCTSLKSVTIPDSVTSIGDCAFEYCTSLTSVTIGKSVTIIGGSAFNGCESLTSVTIGNSVTSIEYGAFKACTSLKVVTVPDSVEKIGFLALGYIDRYYSDVTEDYVNETVYDFTIIGKSGSVAETYANKNYFTFIDLDNESYSHSDKKSSIEVVAKADAELVVNEITNKQSLDNVSVLLENEEGILNLYDISLVKNNEKIQHEGMAEVIIPCSKKNAKVYRVESDNTLTDMKAVYNDGYLIFYTEHFSKYVVAAPPSTAVFGDVDGDGVVTVMDATEIQRYKAEIISDDMIDLTAADVDKDGKVTILDATRIQRYKAELCNLDGSTPYIA